MYKYRLKHTYIQYVQEAVQGNQILFVFLSYFISISREFFPKLTKIKSQLIKTNKYTQVIVINYNSIFWPIFLFFLIVNTDINFFLVFIITIRGFILIINFTIIALKLFANVMVYPHSPIVVWNDITSSVINYFNPCSFSILSI